jgi:dTDP-4-amino-4,6-dideoxygalactose transaminase
MDAIQGACLAIKLKHLERGNERRRAHAARYTAALTRSKKSSLHSKLNTLATSIMCMPFGCRTETK